MNSITQLKHDWFAKLEKQLREPEHSAPTAILQQLSQQQTAYEKQDPEADYQGRELLERIIRNTPQYGHLIPRDLFWFLGGECLHFLGDEELNSYQKVEEIWYEHPNRSYQSIKSEVFGLN